MISLWSKNKIKKYILKIMLQTSTTFVAWSIITKDEHTRPCGNKLTRLLQKTCLFVKLHGK